MTTTPAPNPTTARPSRPTPGVGAVVALKAGEFIKSRLAPLPQPLRRRLAWTMAVDTLRALAEAVEAAVAGIGPALADGWRVASLSLVRSRIARTGGDRWSATAEFRVRIYRES